MKRTGRTPPRRRPAPAGATKTAAGAAQVRALAVALLVLATMGLLERGARALLSRYVLPTAGAEWIWAPGALEAREPIAFFAVRDFELGAVPAGARMHVLADESYVVWLNGARVGSGDYFAGSPLDTYPLDGLLRPGPNRLAVELRSARGAGGLLCTLEAEEATRPLARSGGDWRIFREAPGVVEGLRPAAEGEPALVWQSPPTGGWGLPRLSPQRPAWEDATPAPPGRLLPVAVRASPDPALPVPPGMPPTLDLGRTVTGYLLLDGLEGAPRRFRIATGLDPSTASDGFDVLLAEGQASWSSTEVRSFRYLSSPHLPVTATATALEAAPELARLDAARQERRRRGVFGVEPPES